MCERKEKGATYIWWTVTGSQGGPRVPAWWQVAVACSIRLKKGYGSMTGLCEQRGEWQTQGRQQWRGEQLLGF